MGFFYRVIYIREFLRQLANEEFDSFGEKERNRFGPVNGCYAKANYTSNLILVNFSVIVKLSVSIDNRLNIA